jgi:glucose/arabinose dehydrogenase
VGDGEYTAVTPVRLLDTRGGPTLGPRQQRRLVVTGTAGGTPTTGVAAVALNLVATEVSAPTYLSVLPGGSLPMGEAPATSSLNVVVGDTRANLVVGSVNQSDGSVSLYNDSGTTHVVADLVGWWSTAPSGAGRYTPLTPGRLLDTREPANGTALSPGATRDLTVTGSRGVPSSGVSAVALNVTAVQPTRSTYLTVWPAGTALPPTSTLNADAGAIVANAAPAGVGAGGKVSIRNELGDVHVVVDVVGWWGAGASGARFTAVTPTRLVDTRSGGPVADLPLDLLTTTPPVPATDVSAVVLNVTVTQPSRESFLTAWPAGFSRPPTSNSVYLGGQTVAANVMAKVGADGKISLGLAAGSAHLVVDVVGWTDDDAPALTASTHVSGLVVPWDLAFTPDGAMLITERPGRLRVFRNGVLEPPLVVPGVYAVGEGGLLGMALDPDFATNRFVYLCLDQADGAGNPVDVRVTKWQLDAGYSSFTGGVPLVTGLPISSSGLHSGCRPRFGPDGHLWIGTGDALQGVNPQSESSLGGKVLRVDRELGNPVPGNLNGLIYTKGHRNVQGLAVRPGTSQVFSVEHGPDRDDEVNLLRAGGNYGWDPVPGYEQSRPMTDFSKFPDAVGAVWSSGFPTIATSGATFVTGGQWRGWDGALIVACLKGEQLRVFGLDAAGGVVRDQVALQGVAGRLRTPVQGPDGALYVTTSNGSNDQVLRVVPS